MKLLVSIIFSFTVLFADLLPAYLYKGVCYKSFYYKDKYLYLVKFNDSQRRVYKGTEPLSGYLYDDESGVCSYSDTAIALGLTQRQYSFLMGLLGLLIGGFLFQLILFLFRGRA